MAASEYFIVSIHELRYTAEVKNTDPGVEKQNSVLTKSTKDGFSYDLQV